MKNPARFLLMAFFAFVFVMHSTVTLAAVSGGTVDVEYLTDSDGYNYGANFFVSTNINEPIYAFPYITSQENVNGAVTSGPIPLAANEQHFRIGSFICADRSKAWSVDVNCKFERQ